MNQYFVCKSNKSGEFKLENIENGEILQFLAKNGVNGDDQIKIFSNLWLS